MEVREQPVVIASLLPPCWFQGSISGCQTWKQEPLPLEPSCWPKNKALQFKKHHTGQVDMNHHEQESMEMSTKNQNSGKKQSRQNFTVFRPTIKTNYAGL